MCTPNECDAVFRSLPGIRCPPMLPGAAQTWRGWSVEVRSPWTREEPVRTGRPPGKFPSAKAKHLVNRFFLRIKRDLN